MNVGAHPLVVAVALGLLGPGVLTAVERGADRCARGCAPGEEGRAACVHEDAPSAADEADPLAVDRLEAIWTDMQR